MNGATTEPDVNTIRLPNNIRQRMIGRSQNFFRSFMKDQSSNKKLPMGYLHKLFNIVVSDVKLDEVCEQFGSCLDRVSTAAPWDLYPATISIFL